jgi:predicted Zn-dependent protease with MMP-like domain/regulator of sirC expression with transglutaminase-like and TPR domain
MTRRGVPKSQGQDAVEALLAQADSAFQRAEPERALLLADQALTLAPTSPEALHYRAAALASLGRVDESHDAYRLALRSDPEDLETLHGAIDLLVHELGEERDSLEDALELAERALALARRREAPDLERELLMLGGMALNKLGDARRALEALDRARALSPDDPEIGLERAIALFSLCRFGDAKKQLERVLESVPTDGWAHHYLGLVAERSGSTQLARKHFQLARHHSPEDFPAPVELSADAFDKAIEDALSRLPGRVKHYLTNVSIVVQDLPRHEDLCASEPPLPPALLGLFAGQAISERSGDPWSHFPSQIVLYQKNLQRFARSREELIEQIGITLMHEVGHFLGLSEDDLYQRGLD